MQTSVSSTMSRQSHSQRRQSYLDAKKRLSY
jgi:hypothetical protein